MTQYGTWVSYSGTTEIVLATVLAGAAAGVAYAGLRLPLPARLPRPGGKAGVFMIATWLVAMVALGVCTWLDVQAHHARAPRP